MSLSRISNTVAVLAVGAALLLSTDAQTLTAVPISAPLITSENQPQVLPAVAGTNDQLLTHQGPGSGLVPQFQPQQQPQPVPFNPNGAQIEPAFLNNNPNGLLQPNQLQPQLQPQVQPLQPQVQPNQFQPQLQPQVQPFQPQPNQLQPQFQPQVQPLQPQFQPQPVDNAAILVDPNPNNRAANPTFAPTNLNLNAVDNPNPSAILDIASFTAINPNNAQVQPTQPQPPQFQPQVQPGQFQPQVQPQPPQLQPQVQPQPNQLQPPQLQPQLQPQGQPQVQPFDPSLLNAPAAPAGAPTAQPLPPNAGGIGNINLSTPVIAAPSVDPTTNTLFCQNHLKGCTVDGQTLCIDQNLLVCHENLLCPVEIPDVCLIKSSNDAPQCYNKNVLLCKDGELIPLTDQ